MYGCIYISIYINSHPPAPTKFETPSTVNSPRAQVWRGICMYVYMYIHLYTYIHTYIFIYAYIHTCMHRCHNRSSSLRRKVALYIHTYVFIYTYIYFFYFFILIFMYINSHLPAPMKFETTSAVNSLRARVWIDRRRSRRRRPRPLWHRWQWRGSWTIGRIQNKIKGGVWMNPEWTVHPK